MQCKTKSENLALILGYQTGAVTAMMILSSWAGVGSGGGGGGSVRPWLPPPRVSTILRLDGCKRQNEQRMCLIFNRVEE